MCDTGRDPNGRALTPPFTGDIFCPGMIEENRVTVVYTMLTCPESREWLKYCTRYEVKTRMSYVLSTRPPYIAFSISPCMKSH